MAKTRTGKGELVRILHEFSGMPKEVIRIYARYTDYGNKKQLDCGGYSVVKQPNGIITILYPVYGTFEDDYIGQAHMIWSEPEEGEKDEGEKEKKTE